jgi:ribosomal-protein-serine acetyltransferase
MLSLDLGEGAALRLLEERHARELYAVVDANRARLRNWLAWLDHTQRVEDVAVFIRSSLKSMAKGHGCVYGIFQDGKIAGVIDYHAMSRENRRVSIGYWLGEAWEGRGLMTRAVTALCNHAFGELGLNRVEIRAAVENLRSRAIPQRLGFREEGTLRQVLWLYDRFVDEVVHSVVAEEWAKR